MAKRLNMLVFAAMVVAAILQSSAAQTTHVVLDTLGWSLPQGGSVDYTNWASRQTFAVGDVLVFNFTTGAHDVAEVSKADFDSCNSASPISQTNTGPANITINSAGQHYYICTFNGHCNAGQKLEISVSGSSTTTPSSPSPSGSTAPPPPASSAPSFAVAALPVTLLSIAVALLH